MISRLAELLAPDPEPMFWNMVRARALTLRRGTGSGRFEDLVSWDALLQAIDGGRQTRVRLTRHTASIAPVFYSTGDRVDGGKVRRLLDANASLLLNGLGATLPNLGQLNDDIRTRTTDLIELAAVMTTGAGGALPIHFDPEDVLVVQVEGAKRWQVYGASVLNPVRTTPLTTPPDDAAILDEELRAGDWLFVPAGHWHVCENRAGRSLHVVIMMYPLCAQNAMEAIARQMASDETLRRPLARGADPKDAEAALKTLLLDHIQRLSLAEIVAAHKAGSRRAY